MKTLGIIPARYSSTRFPGKPLANIGGKIMIQRVYEQASKAIENVIVATDDQRIFDAVENFGGEAVMTSENHLNGTSRCLEAAHIYSKKTNINFDIIANIQGDEPLISPIAIKGLVTLFEDKKTEIGTLINETDYSDELLNPNRIKVVIDKNQRGIYFSRSLIPYVRDKKKYPETKFYSHIGVYAYRANILEQIAQLKPSMIEIAESLEQNRWIENGFYIKTQITNYHSIGVDSPEDIEKILVLLK